MTIVTRWTDYQGRIVELTDEGWTHILEGHPCMESRLDAIGAAVISPIFVIRDRDRRRVEHHYGEKRGRLHTVVIVIYRPTPDGWVGTVLTALRTERLEKGEQLWP